MNNFDIARQALDSSLHSAGSAQEENAKYLDSIEGRMQNFNSSFQELSSATLNSDFLKGGISAATKFLDILTKIQSVPLGTPATLLGGVGLAGFIKNLD